MTSNISKKSTGVLGASKDSLERRIKELVDIAQTRAYTQQEEIDLARSQLAMRYVTLYEQKDAAIDSDICL